MRIHKQAREVNYSIVLLEPYNSMEELKKDLELIVAYAINSVLHYRDLYPPIYKVVYETPAFNLHLRHDLGLHGSHGEGRGGVFDLTIGLAGKYTETELVFTIVHEVAHVLCIPDEDPEQKTLYGIRVDWEATADSYANAAAEAISFNYYAEYAQDNVGLTPKSDNHERDA